MGGEPRDSPNGEAMEVGEVVEVGEVLEDGVTTGVTMAGEMAGETTGETTSDLMVLLEAEFLDLLEPELEALGALQAVSQDLETILEDWAEDGDTTLLIKSPLTLYFANL